MSEEQAGEDPPSPPATNPLEILNRATRTSKPDAATVLVAFDAARSDRAFAGRAYQLAPGLVAALRRSGARTEACKIAEESLAVVTGADIVALLRGQQMLLTLDQGDLPDTSEAIQLLLSRADAAASEGNHARAAAMLHLALDVALHRTLHTEDIPSPLAANPSHFLAAFRKSQTYRALGAHSIRGFWRGLVDTARRSIRERWARPHRLLFVGNGNWNFTEELLGRYGSRGGWEVRTLDLATPPHRHQAPKLEAMIAERVTRALGGPSTDLLWPQAADLLDWADTVFVDWCDNAALWVSLATPRSRVVVRLHSLEALSIHPHVVDWDAVSDLVFVGAHLRGLTAAVVPGSIKARWHVVPNAIRLQHLARPKMAEANRTLALVGWSTTVKDPLFAVETLRLLRQQDPAWRLLLIGHDFPSSIRARSARYRDAFYERIAQADVRDGIEFVAFTDDLAVVFQRAGFVLSTGLRESFHVGLVQGAASGAVPVVRNWPVVARYGGPAALFPRNWIVRSPEAAAARIRTHSDPSTRTEAGRAAREYVLGRYDWPVVAPQYDRLLGGP
jgi:glycosyltransferase involved in cell wall biosynthesis